MKYDLVAPCGQCPFRYDIKGFLTPDRAEEILESITDLQQTFPCHKTVEYGEDDDSDFHIPSADEQHCAGAMIFLEKQNMPNQMMRIAERLGLYDRTKLHMESPVFDEDYEMVEHMERG